jgi:hypothetical protein
MSETKNVAKKEQSQVATFNSNLLKQAGGSLNKKSSDDYQIPYLNIIMKGSPQLKKGDEKHIEGAEEGMVFNTVTKQLYKNLTVLPVYYKRSYVEWKLVRKQATAPIAEYSISEYEQMKREGKIVRDENNKDRIVGGDTYVENTASHFVIVVEEDGSWNQAIIKMKASQLKKSRTWNSIMSNQRRKDGNEIYQPKDFARSYSLSTKYEENDVGDWYGWVISQGLWIDEIKNPNLQKIWEDAIRFEKAIHQGEVSGAEEDYSDNTTATPSGNSAEADSDLPF